VKRNECKIISASTELGQVVFAYSGNVPLARAVIHKCIRRIRRPEGVQVSDNNDLAGIVEEILGQEYRKHVAPSPDPDKDSVYQLLFAVWARGSQQASLYSTWQTAVIPHDRYESI